MEIIDGKETKRKKQKTRGARAKWFCCAFKLGFPQLTCKASLIFKLNLELALSLTLPKKASLKKHH